MLYRYSEVFRTLIGVADLCLVAAAWLLATHFSPDAAGPGTGGPALVWILPLFFLLFRGHGLYEPRRTSSALNEAGLVLRASAFGVLLIVSGSYLLGSTLPGRAAVVSFGLLAPAAVSVLRAGVRAGLHAIRRRGLNLRYVIVVGAGRPAEEIIERIKAHPEAGLFIRGVLSDSGARGASVCGVPVIGSYAALKPLLDARPERRVDQVIVALAREESDCLEKVLVELDDEPVNVILVPDLGDAMTQQSAVENLDGLPVINLRTTPLVGWSAVAKRAFDITVAGLLLLAASPLLLAIAVAVAISSGRPVLFSQERMGLDGRVFRILKFRSMIEGAERETGPVFTDPFDERRTRLGTLLRRYSLDELPQLWNVLRGDMSLVGPRPERPIFIESFRSEIPRYMQRHEVKAGMTGWAQVHGWRGKSSIHERVEHDLFYIRNWSFGLDVRILLMTLWRGIRSPNAY